MARYDILPSRDMQKVKKDLKDIKKKLSKKKSQVKKKQVFKVLPHKDVVVVKKDISDIKKTLEEKALRDKPERQLVRVTRFDNYYDMLPHKRIKELELQLITLRDRLRKKRDKTGVNRRRNSLLPRSTRLLLSLMSKLNTSILSMIQLFEKADEIFKTAEAAPVVISTPSSDLDLTPLTTELGEVKARLEELSAENEEMAKGILVIAEMLKENPPEKKPEPPKKPDDISFGFVPKPDAPKPEAPKPDAPRSDAPKPDAPRSDTPKPDAPKPEAPRQENIPPMGSPFEPFYRQPGPSIPPAKDGSDRRRLNQF